MESDNYPLFMSFMIRFVLESPSSHDGEKPHYRGTIRHIQSNEDLNFNTFDDAIKFIQRFMPLEIKRSQDST
jgi:hypothetical protein